MKLLRIKHLFNNKKESFIDKEVTVNGWVKTIRNQKNFAFIEINDGSTFSNLQVLLFAEAKDFDKIDTLTTGSSITVTGKVVKSPGKNQSIELHAEKLIIVGLCDGETYPLQKKRHSFEYLRTIAHLRPRTNTQGAINRVKNSLAFATHKYFQENDFIYITPPIITGLDCEGTGEMFKVTTLDESKAKKLDNQSFDYSHDFFGKPTYLTVSGQLEAEALACALYNVYSFGPTFRAENSHTTRHLAEFWMIEPEMAFCDLQGNMEYAEEYIKYITKYVLENNMEDMIFFDNFIEKGLIKRLEKLIQDKFQRVTYTEAIDILQNSNQKFEFPVKWGADIQSEHERYLCEKQFNSPVILTDYPKEIKAFYMRENDDHKTVAAMDVLVPGVGEIIGGSQREERLDILESKMKKMNLKQEDYWWYLDLRKYGSVPHSGFGLGFERLVNFITGVDNIRDIIPFPRYPNHAEF